jgi:hypothetical protein
MGYASCGPTTSNPNRLESAAAAYGRTVRRWLGRTAGRHAALLEHPARSRPA